MPTPPSNPTKVANLFLLLGATLLWVLVSARPAWAIPTPDVLIGAAQGASSLLGVLALSGFGLWVGKWLRRPIIRAVVIAFLVGSAGAGGVWLTLQWKETTTNRMSVFQRDDTALYKEMDGTPEIQARNPKGLTAQTLAALLADPPANTFFYDIREDGEHHTAAIEGLKNTRGPELRTQSFPPGSRVIVTCYSGMRGSQVCKDLAKLGIDCRFLIGGLKTWREQGLPMSPLPTQGAGVFGSMVPYPNQRTLLSTYDVQGLLERGAIPVDASSYAGAAQAKKAGVFHLPLFTATRQDFRASLDRLPPGPVFGVCSGEISCAETDALGYAATQAGREWMGAWASDDAMPPPRNATLWEIATHGMAQRAHAVDKQLGWPGAGAVAIGVFTALGTLLLRKAGHRDAQNAARTRDRLRKMRTQWGHDPVHLHRLRRVARATWYEGLPSTAGSLLAVGLSVVATSVAAQTTQTPWPSTLVIAVALGVGVFVLLLPVCGKRGAWLFASFSGSTLLAVAVLDHLLPIGSSLAAAGAVWCAIVAKGLPALWRIHQDEKAKRAGVFPLTRHALHTPGAKATNLQALAEAGYSVPPTLLVDPTKHCPIALQSWLGQQKTTSFAVRSSGAREDRADSSQAGLYVSVLRVAPIDVEQAVAAVARSIHYEGCVLIQPMIDAVFSGVIFTEDPQHGGCLRIEYTQGTNEDVTAGTATPTVERRGYATLERLEGTPPPFPSDALAAMAKRWEDEQGCPQDIEWAWDGNTFVFLQSRPITRTLMGNPSSTDCANPLEAERSRLVRNVARMQSLHCDSLSETMPHPSRLGLSLWQSVWEPGAAVDQATRVLGLTYEPSPNGAPAYTTAFGWLVRTGTGPTIEQPTHRQAQRALVKGKRWAHDHAVAMGEHGKRLDLWEAVDPQRLSNTALRRLFADVVQAFLEVDQVPSTIGSILASLDMDAEHTAPSHDQPLWFSTWRAAHQGDPQAIKAVGHRSSSDEDPGAPRWSETGIPTPPPERRHTQPTRYGSEINTLSLKEDSKHMAVRSIALVRQLALEIGRRSGAGDLMFCATWQELAAEAPPTAAALHNRARFDASIRHNPMPALTAEALERWGKDQAPAAPGPQAATLVSGDKGFAGTVLRVDWEKDGDLVVAPDTVVVCTALPPHRVAQLEGCAGVVVAVGGMLSHAAILAREHGLPMVVLPSAGHLQTGDSFSV